MNRIKCIVKKTLANFSYKFNKRKYSKIKVASVDETIKTLQTTNKSLIRFGDGEILSIQGKNLTLQKTDSGLSADLAQILENMDERIMVTIQDIFETTDIYLPDSSDFWKEHLMFFGHVYWKHCRPKEGRQKYYNTLFSRFYITLKNHSKCDEWASEIRKIWKDKDIVLIEGETSHNGVENDLFDTAKSVERIIGPAENAYAKLDSIIDAAMNYEKNRLFLVTLGPTAKPIVKILTEKGYRALDIGNLDTEYSLYLMNASSKMIMGKHLIRGVEANKKAGFTQYLKEIKYTSL